MVCLSFCPSDYRTGPTLFPIVYFFDTSFKSFFTHVMIWYRGFSLLMPTYVSLLPFGLLPFLFLGDLFLFVFNELQSQHQWKILMFKRWAFFILGKDLGSVNAVHNFLNATPHVLFLLVVFKVCPK